VTGLVPVMLGSALGGNKLVMMYKWTPERALELIERERVTTFAGVPTQSHDLLESPRMTPTLPHCVIAAILHLCHAAPMKATLTVTRRGVVTLPVKLRRALGLEADDRLIAETTPDGLLLRPTMTLPIEMYSDARVREFDEAEAELATLLRPQPKPRGTQRQKRKRVR